MRSPRVSRPAASVARPLPAARPMAASARTGPAGAGHDFGMVAVHAPAAMGTAVAAGPIQRLLSAGEFAGERREHGDEGHDRRLGRVQRHLDAYHATAEGTPQERIAALNRVHRSAYRWFNATKSGTGLTRPEGTPNTALMQRLMREADDEHVERTRDVANDATALPFDTAGMDEQQVAAAHGTWRSVVGGHGNLQIQGDDAFRDRTRSQIAKLMQHPTGRQLVGDVNEHFRYRRWRNKTVTIGSDFSRHPVFQNAEVPPGSLAVATDTPSSRILSGTPSRTDRALHYTGARTSPDLARGGTLARNIDSSINGGSDYGFQVPGHAPARYNSGSSVLLRMVPHAEEGGDTMVDAGMNQIVNPDFVTLGHELGHARRMQRGASLDRMGTADGTLRDMGVGGEDPAGEWSNPEEFVNITRTENPIRDEHGLTERSFHKGHRTLTATRRIKGLRRDVNERMAGVRERLGGIDHPELNEHRERLRDESEDAQDHLTERGVNDPRLLMDPDHLDRVAAHADDVEQRANDLLRRHRRLTGDGSSSSGSRRETEQ